jgi:hypothetical protein
MPASFGTALVMMLLRFGPRPIDHSDDEELPPAPAVNYESTQNGSETQSLLNTQRSVRLKKRASLASVV